VVGKLPFHIHIAEDEETSKRKPPGTNEKGKVYPYGSAIYGQVGAAAVLLRQGHPPRALNYHLGPDNKHTVREAELAGILLAIHLIKTEKNERTTHAIGVDNQAAIKAIPLGPQSEGWECTLATEITQKSCARLTSYRSNNHGRTRRYRRKRSRRPRGKESSERRNIRQGVPPDILETSADQ
jgi:hypothetical protein